MQNGEMTDKVISIPSSRIDLEQNYENDMILILRKKTNTK